jgi:hypothetical protein
MLSSLPLFWGQHECTSTWARGSNGGSILQNEAWHLHIAGANRPDCLLRGYQVGCERQRLHQVQGGQAQIRGPDLRQTPTQPTQSPPTTTTTPMQPAPTPHWTGAQQPHPAGRSLHWPPALGAGAGAARGGREGVVKRLLARPKADATGN